MTARAGWVVLISLGVLVLTAHANLISQLLPHAQDIHRNLREKSRIQDRWQYCECIPQRQSYRSHVNVGSIAKFWDSSREAAHALPATHRAGDFSLVMDINNCPDIFGKP